MVGINTAIASSTGGWVGIVAIPINVPAASSNNLVKQGEVVRLYLAWSTAAAGIDFAAPSARGAAEDDVGAVILLPQRPALVLPGSSPDKAGLRPSTSSAR